MSFLSSVSVVYCLVPPAGSVSTEVGLSPGGEHDLAILGDVAVGKGEGKGGGAADDGTGGGVLGSVAGAHELVVGSGPRDDAAKVGADGVEAVGLEGLVVLDDKVTVQFGLRRARERKKVSIPACGIGEIRKSTSCVSQKSKCSSTKPSCLSSQNVVACGLRRADVENCMFRMFRRQPIRPSKQVLQANQRWETPIMPARSLCVDFVPRTRPE